MSTIKRAVTSYGWGVKAGMVRMWVSAKSPCYTWAISERFNVYDDKTLNMFTLVYFTF